jgi:hypothetical protein
MLLHFIVIKLFSVYVPDEELIPLVSEEPILSERLPRGLFILGERKNYPN